MNSLQSDFPDRLVTLSTGSPGLRGCIQIQVQPPPQAETKNQNSKIENPPVLDFVSSDETLDRYSEIVTAAGWRLDSYRRNPVFQNAHQYGDIIFTLGKALVTEVRAIDGRACLYQRIEFATEANPISRIAHALYKGGYINTVSVGFIPVRWENGTETSTFRRKYLEQDLLEVSAVAIPANPNALALALKSGAIERATLAETLDLLRSADSVAARQPSEHPLLPNPPQGPSLLELARQLRVLLRS